LTMREALRLVSSLMICKNLKNNGGKKVSVVLIWSSKIVHILNCVLSVNLSQKEPVLIKLGSKNNAQRCLLNIIVNA